jgi:hypothetical protein
MPIVEYLDKHQFLTIPTREGARECKEPAFVALERNIAAVLGNMPVPE